MRLTDQRATAIANPPRYQEVFRQLQTRRYQPHPWYRQPHLMTLASHFLKRPNQLPVSACEARIFETEPGVRVLAHCNWQPVRETAATLVVAHGLEGSTQTHYMINTAIKALAAGFNVVRINQRGCGLTHHLTPRSYHAGLTADLRAVIQELIEVDHCSELYLLGYSLGGNQSLKLAGEYANQPPPQLRAVCAASVPIDLKAVSEAIHNWHNLIFEWNFLRVLHRSLRRFQRHHPSRYNLSREWKGVTIRRFDDLFTAPCNGFNSAEQYYREASSAPYLSKISLPTLIIQAQDDPFIPFHMYQQADFSETTALLAPPTGGHLGFLSAQEEGEDRYWAENRAIEFFSLIRETFQQK